MVFLLPLSLAAQLLFRAGFSTAAAVRPFSVSTRWAMVIAFITMGSAAREMSRRVREDLIRYGAAGRYCVQDGELAMFEDWARGVKSPSGKAVNIGAISVGIIGVAR